LSTRENHWKAFLTAVFPAVLMMYSLSMTGAMSILEKKDFISRFLQDEMVIGKSLARMLCLLLLNSVVS
jgi:hypothetical protein